MDWSELLSLNFWFNSQPGFLNGLATKFLLVVFALCLIAAIIFYLIARVKKEDKVTFKLLGKFQNLFITLGLVGLFILFFFWQQIPYLSSRYWLIVWLLVVLVWAGFIGRFIFFEAPKRRVELREKKDFEKYLPRKKKRRK